MKLLKYIIFIIQVEILFLLPVSMVFANITEPGAQGARGKVLLVSIIVTALDIVDPSICFENAGSQG